uniref:BAG domain-containing protein n=1 Tax=Opuntia streptacantha TaxID=393608 RepID=A0A7C8YKH8_OPUST
MAFQNHHHHRHHQIHQTAAASTASFCCCCCCQPPPCHHYTPPSAPPYLNTDPFAVAAIVSQLLQTPSQTPLNSHDFCPQTLKPTKINRKQRYPHPETDQFQHPQSGFFSLLQRVDALEAALRRFSCSSSFSLRDAAARTIQTHFRAYLVRRSRALRHLKELATIKSAVASLKSSLSRRGFVDFDFLSSRAMELLLQVDSIQGDDQMIRDSKRSITKDIDHFLDLLDGICVKRHQVITKTMRNMRVVGNDNSTAYDHGREFSKHGIRSKCQSMSEDENKLLQNLRRRAERIGRLSRELEDEDEDGEMEGYKHVGEDEDDTYIPKNSNKHQMENGELDKKNAVRQKRVTFVEDGNVVRVYDIEENTSLDVNEAEHSRKGVQDEAEAWNCVA